MNWLHAGARLLRPLQVHLKSKLFRIKTFLVDYSGAIQSDSYSVYKHLAKNNPNLKHLQCWAHVRARFKYAEEAARDSLASWFVTQIGRLYLVEAECLLKGLSAEETC